MGVTTEDTARGAEHEPIRREDVRFGREYVRGRAEDARVAGDVACRFAQDA
jgi:hypothetical protein